MLWLFTWWRLFQKRVVRTKLDIYVFTPELLYTYHYLICVESFFFLEIIELVPSSRCIKYTKPTMNQPTDCIISLRGEIKLA